jgi:hypothetical protein
MKAKTTGRKAKFFVVYTSTALPHTRFSSTVHIDLGRFNTLEEANAEAMKIARKPGVRKNTSRVRIDIRRNRKLFKRITPNNGGAI